MMYQIYGYLPEIQKCINCDSAKRLCTAKKKEFEFMKKQRELEEKQKNLDFEMEKKIFEERKKIESSLEEKFRENSKKEMPSMKEFFGVKTKQGFDFLGAKFGQGTKKVTLEKNLLLVKSKLDSTMAKKIGQYIITQIANDNEVNIPSEYITEVENLLIEKNKIMEALKNG